MRSEDRLPSSPFTKRLEFAGIFERGNVRSPPLSVEIVYSTINGHPPVGIVRGTSKEFDALERFFYGPRRSSPLCTMRSTSPDRQVISCSDVFIPELSNKTLPKDEREIVHQVIGRFSIGELAIRTTLSGKAGPKRQRVFMLEGPCKLWLSRALRTLSYTGAIRSRRLNSSFSLKGAPHDKISVAPSFFYAEQDRRDRDQRETIQFERFSLTVADAKKVERDENAFFVNTAALTETLCLLMSFLSKARIDWSSSVCSDGGVVVETYRDVPAWKGEEPRWEELIIDSKDIRRFLNNAFTTYEKSTKEAFDLRLPLLHYILSQTSRYAEDRFALLFFALEKLLTSMDERYKGPDLLSDTELSNLWKVVQPALTDMGKTPDQMALIREKRRELQRPPLKYRTSRHLATLGIDLSDLDGDAGLGKMIRVRNKLTHDKDEVPIKEIVFETRRLETIVERMLLKLLGWNGREVTPTYRNRPIRDED